MTSWLGIVSYPLSFWIYILLLVHLSSGVLVNVTIDDTNGDAMTGVKPNWVVGWRFSSSSCRSPSGNAVEVTTCLQEVDPSFAYDGTWTGVTINTTTSAVGGASQMNLTFTGTAIYVYHIIPAQNAFSASVFGISYSVDGEEYTLESYSKTPSTQYDQLAYAREGLELVEHNLGVLIGDPETPQMFFDYALYTTDDGTGTSYNVPTPTTSMATASTVPDSGASSIATSRINIAAAIGGSVGGAAFLLGCIIIIYALYRRRRRRRGSPSEAGSGRVDIPRVRGETRVSSWRDEESQPDVFTAPDAHASLDQSCTSRFSEYSVSDSGVTSSHSHKGPSLSTMSFAPRMTESASHVSEGAPLPSTPSRSKYSRGSGPVDYRNSGSFISPRRDSRTRSGVSQS